MSSRPNLDEPCGSNCHPEDVFVTEKPWRPVRRFDEPRDTKFLTAYVNKGPAVLQGYGDRVYARKIEGAPVDKSLELIHPDDLWWWIREENGKRKNRALFRAGHVSRTRYDLAVTDPVWLEELHLLSPRNLSAHILFSGQASQDLSHPEPERAVRGLSLQAGRRRGQSSGLSALYESFAGCSRNPRPATLLVSMAIARDNTPERLVSAARADEEQGFELKLRPRWLREFIGQSKAKEQLAIALEAAKSRGEALDHVLLFGPPGLGKTTLATIIANELDVGFQQTSGPALQIQGDLTAILTNLRERQVLFLDEIHRHAAGARRKALHRA